MAQSRLERIGTIFSRVTGLLEAGAMKPNDKPIWYNVYAAFPPKLEPRFDRPVQNVPVRNIFYEEDICRAKYHKSLKQPEVVNLLWKDRESQTQQFIKIYQKLKAQGALDEEKIFETALELWSAEQEIQKQKKEVSGKDDPVMEELSFEEAQYATVTEAISNKDDLQRTSKSDESDTTKTKTTTTDNFDVKSLFKE